jgi:UDP-N-acetylmuramate dehydrogenase
MESGELVLSARMELVPGERSAIEAVMDDLNARRVSKQPVDLPSAGSFFKRPEGYFAGKLIEDCGLKGVSVGGAQVSPLHAGFIVNTGDADVSDVIKLMHIVQESVMHRFGVMLEPEVRIIG